MSETVHSLATRALRGTQAGPQQDEAAQSVLIKRLFMLFHGRYGNLFLSKFATGELDAQGKDKGMLSARIVWQSELRDFGDEIVMEAARRAGDVHPEFPPSLPQFVALCRAAAPRKTWTDENPAPRLSMSDALRTERSRRARDEAMAKYHARRGARAEGVEGDVSALHRLVAQAVGLAGGDEAAHLHRIEAMQQRNGGES